MQGWEMDLYGKGFDDSSSPVAGLHYHGFIASDDFIAQADADFGLVWDGDSLNECTGDWGEYLRINDPHKTSFYLRAGIPVIVWKEAAMAPFIEQQKVGISVGSLSEISQRLSTLSTADYQLLKQNAMAMSHRLDEGYYIKDKYYRMVVCGIGVAYIFQTFLTIGGGAKFIPLTGVTLPLVSYGGTSVLVTIVMIMIAEGICMIRTDERFEAMERRKQKREQERRQNGTTTKA
jgi:hypothetical protein